MIWYDLTRLTADCWLTVCVWYLESIECMHLLLSFIPFIILLCSHTHSSLICSVLNPTSQITVQTHASYPTLPYDMIWYPLSTLHTVMLVGRSYTYHNIPYLTIHWELDCHWKCNMAHSLSRIPDILHTYIRARTFLADVWFGIGIDVDLLFQCQLTWHTYTWCTIRIGIGIFNPLPAADSFVLSCTGTVPVCVSCPVFATTDNGITDWRGWGLIESSPNTQHYLYDIMLHIPSIGHHELYWYCRPARAPLTHAMNVCFGNTNVQICADAIIHTWCTCTVPMSRYVMWSCLYLYLAKLCARHVSLSYRERVWCMKNVLISRGWQRHVRCTVPYHDILICSVRFCCFQYLGAIWIDYNNINRQ